MEKSICAKCIYADCHFGHSNKSINCELPSNIKVFTNYVTGDKSIIYEKECINKNKFGNCRDFVEYITLFQELKRYLTNLFSHSKINKKVKND